MKDLQESPLVSLDIHHAIIVGATIQAAEGTVKAEKLREWGNLYVYSVYPLSHRLRSPLSLR